MSTVAMIYSKPTSNNIALEDLVVRTPMTLDVDGDFAAYSCPGDGSPGNPYRIENYNITTTGQPCLSFAGYTTKHFIVQNCFLKTNTYDAILLGKYQEMAAGTVNIFNNTIISRNHTALTLNGSIGGVIQENNIVSLEGGIEIEEDFTYVSGNTINAKTAIKFTDSKGAEIIDNICEKNTELGIRAINCTDITITGNTGSLILEGCLNGKIIDGNGVDFDGGITVKDSNFTYVKGNIVRANTAIQITNSIGTTLVYNVCDDNAEVGINLMNSNDTVITGNECSGNGDSGIRAENSINLTLSYNHLSGNYFGMKIIGSSNSLVINNYFESNTGYGVSMHGSVGINKLYHNAFVDNNLAGSSIQAFDDTGDQWYNEELQEGNFWNDWSPIVSASYDIEGAAASEDLYPLEEMPDIPEYTIGFSIFLIITFFIAIPIILYNTRK
jgi:parallel beta-helix repeat protein